MVGFMKIKKIIIVTAVCLMVGLGFVAYKVWDSLDHIIETAIESYGPDVIGATISLDSVKLDLSAGKAELNGLSIGNPKGFKTDYAMQVQQVRMILDIDSLTSDVIVVKEISINNPAITYEMAKGGSNIDVLAKNAQNYVGMNSQENSQSEGDEPKLIIENFRIDEGQVNVSHSLLKGKALTVGLPKIHLTDIGKSEDGTSPGQVAQEIMQSIKDAAGVAVTSLGLGDTFSSGAKAVQKGANSVMDSAKGAGDKIKGLFD
jgi:hypothetical protein